MRGADIFRYIDNHPLKFAKRELLIVDQVSFPLSANSQSVIDATENLKSIEEIGYKLTEMGVVHTSSVGVLNSGDISEDLFNVMQTKKADGIFFTRSGPNGVYFKLKSEVAIPLKGEAAIGLAWQLLRTGGFSEKRSITRRFRWRTGQIRRQNTQGSGT